MYLSLSAYPYILLYMNRLAFEFKPYAPLRVTKLTKPEAPTFGL